MNIKQDSLSEETKKQKINGSEHKGDFILLYNSVRKNKRSIAEAALVVKKTTPSRRCIPKRET